jgi:DNA-binding NtrC family response regulator
MTHYSARAGAQLPVRLLAVIPEDMQFEFLRSTVEDVGWEIFRANSITDGLSTLVNHKINTIVTGCDLEDGSWLEMINALQPCRNAPRVLVASSHADNRLWLDVLEHGGYDLLAVPFDRNEIVRLASSAYLSWEKNIRGLSSAYFPIDTPDHPCRSANAKQAHVKAVGRL